MVVRVLGWLIPILCIIQSELLIEQSGCQFFSHFILLVICGEDHLVIYDLTNWADDEFDGLEPFWDAMVEDADIFLGMISPWAMEIEWPIWGCADPTEWPNMILGGAVKGSMKEESCQRHLMLSIIGVSLRNIVGEGVNWTLKYQDSDVVGVEIAYGVCSVCINYTTHCFCPCMDLY